MAKLIYGRRIGKSARLTPSCDAVIFNNAKNEVLLTQRADNGRWCLPGGAMEAGENAPECCAREVNEETGLIVEVGRLIGVYSSPHFIAEYSDGNRVHAVDLLFEVSPIGGDMRITDETTAIRYFSLETMESVDVMEPAYERVVDAFAFQDAAFIR